MAYSEWQLNRLRDALRAYHAYTPPDDDADDDADDRKSNFLDAYNWKDVGEAISLAAGPGSLGFSDHLDLETHKKRMKQFAERLRQFVEGKKEKSGRRTFGSMQPESLEAIVKFVTAEDLLSPGELEEYAPPWQSAQRLLEFLVQRFDKNRILPPAMFEGTYKARRTDERGFVVEELTFQRPSADGLMQVTKVEEHYPTEAQHEYDGWTFAERREGRLIRTLYGGWAIFTPEDTVMAFLKQADTLRNLYQFVLAADRLYEPGAAVEQLVVLRHDYPLELESFGTAASQTVADTLQGIEKNVVVFRRSV